jgi:very-short-patch-repair endonuclease
VSKASELETELAGYITMMKLPEPEREYQAISGRKFRFDFAWPDHMIAAEVDGGIYTGGRHTTGTGYEADAEKCNLAVLDGWRVFRFTKSMIRSGTAITWLERALAK